MHAMGTIPEPQRGIHRLVRKKVIVLPPPTRSGTKPEEEQAYRHLVHVSSPSSSKSNRPSTTAPATQQRDTAIKYRSAFSARDFHKPSKKRRRHSPTSVSEQASLDNGSNSVSSGVIPSVICFPTAPVASPRVSDGVSSAWPTSASKTPPLRLPTSRHVLSNRHFLHSFHTHAKENKTLRRERLASFLQQLFVTQDADVLEVAAQSAVDVVGLSQRAALPLEACADIVRQVVLALRIHWPPEGVEVSPPLPFSTPPSAASKRVKRYAELCNTLVRLEYDAFGMPRRVQTPAPEDGAKAVPATMSRPKAKVVSPKVLSFKKAQLRRLKRLGERVDQVLDKLGSLLNLQQSVDICRALCRGELQDTEQLLLSTTSLMQQRFGLLGIAEQRVKALMNTLFVFHSVPLFRVAARLLGGAARPVNPVAWRAQLDCRRFLETCDFAAPYKRRWQAPTGRSESLMLDGLRIERRSAELCVLEVIAPQAGPTLVAQLCAAVQTLPCVLGERDEVDLDHFLETLLDVVEPTVNLGAAAQAALFGDAALAATKPPSRHHADGDQSHLGDACAVDPSLHALKTALD
eukprot:scaffold667_cov262-Pinguiococcus_pyrenoidosus.AAC.10